MWDAIIICFIKNITNSAFTLRIKELIIKHPGLYLKHGQDEQLRYPEQA